MNLQEIIFFISLEMLKLLFIAAVFVRTKLPLDLYVVSKKKKNQTSPQGITIIEKDFVVSVIHV